MNYRKWKANGGLVLSKATKEKEADRVVLSFSTSSPTTSSPSSSSSFLLSHGRQAEKQLVLSNLFEELEGDKKREKEGGGGVVKVETDEDLSDFLVDLDAKNAKDILRSFPFF